MPIRKHRTEALKSKFNGITVYHCTMKVKDVVHISYVAVRGRDQEEGSVQRILNPQRVIAIKEFVLEGNMFFNTFILNWTNETTKPEFMKGSIVVPIAPSSAQIIDGQHRLAGLEAAMETDDKIGEQEILVTFCVGLKTKEAALIFVNINSEQKPVPKSLIYDLFGLMEDDPDHAINRATDIAHELNENENSPYFGAIKFPGQARGVGIIDLSTITTSLKKHLDSGGVFETYNLTKLENQKRLILNYFTALHFYYNREGLWDSRAKNPFLTSAGFVGAIEHLTGRLISKCAESKSFKIADFKKFLALPKGGLLQRMDIKSLEGKSQRKVVTDFLGSSLLKSLPDQKEYEF